MSELDNVNTDAEFAAHLQRLENDPEYKRMCESLYAMLEVATAGGTARNKVTLFHESRDGVAALNNLKDGYSHGGDKEAYVTDVMSDITKLQLTSTTPGGYSSYESKFELKVMAWE